MSDTPATPATPVSADDVTAAALTPAQKSLVIRFLDWALADNWRKAWKWLSMYAYGAIIASPELYDLLMELINGLTAGDAAGAAIPESFAKLIRTLGVAGMVLRIVRQSKRVIEDATPKAE